MGSVTYNNGATLLLVSAQYNSSNPGCNPPYKNWQGAQNYIGAYAYPALTCFTYTNLTNPSSNPAMDLGSHRTGLCCLQPGTQFGGFRRRPGVR